MKVIDALKLKAGDRVHIQYTPMKGHGNPINGIGSVTSQTLSKSPFNYDYIWVEVMYENSKFVISSKFITLTKW